MTFETLLAELRAGNVPNATQNEILLAICKKLESMERLFKAQDTVLRMCLKDGTISPYTEQT